VKRQRVSTTIAPLTSIIIRMDTEAAEVVAVASEEIKISTSRSTTLMRRALLSLRTKIIIITTILQRDTRTLLEVDSVAEEAVTSRKKVKDKEEAAEAEVADLGLLKNIEMKVRLERPNLSSLLMTTVLRVNLNE
jgi:hypothetical protein